MAAYVGAIAVGAVVGLLAPSISPHLDSAITPLLAALLFVTFLQVPASRVRAALGDVRFTLALLVVNFVAVPLVVAVLLRLVGPDDDAVRLGMLLVLLCPCVDYVMVFSGLAGGRADALLAATPLLLIGQFVLLPGYLLLFVGDDLARSIDPQPFLVAFASLIAIPLAAAWTLQAAARRSSVAAHTIGRLGMTMVPLMAAVLAVVVASQITRVEGHVAVLLSAVAVYGLFLAVMPPVGDVVARVAGLDAPARRAVVFSGATRNSLVVLPLALALPSGSERAAAVVVTQTLVELLGMVIYVRLVPRFVRAVR
ncbi:arsenic resistance protein [Gordonia sinesedis]